MNRILIPLLLLLLALPSLAKAQSVVLDRVGGAAVSGELADHWRPSEPERARDIGSRLLEAKVMGEGYVYEEKVAAWEATDPSGSSMILAFSSRGGPVGEQEIARFASWLDGSNLLTSGAEELFLPFRISRITYDQKRRVVTSTYLFHYQQQRYKVISAILFTGYGFCNLIYIGTVGEASAGLEREFNGLVESVQIPRSLRYQEQMWLGLSSTAWKRMAEVGLGVLLMTAAYALLLRNRGTASRPPAVRRPKGMQG